jgi:pimeloyl-ACP methyl ester carboxylesterase
VPTLTATLPAGVAAKDLSFDFGDGWVAQGQITYPADKAGPFPTVILVHGSGNNDMDETLPESAAFVPGGSKFFLPIATYLPTRGFAVVRYNKRGVIGIGPQVSPNITKIVDITKPDTQYTQDAGIVLAQVRKNELVDPSRVIMLGHSEGTLNVSHIVTSPAGKDVAGIVLMGVQAYDVKTSLQYQLVDRTVMFLARDADTNKDGKISVDEFLAWDKQLPTAFQSPYIAGFLVEDSSSPSKYKFNTALDKNGDGLLDLQNELHPFLQAKSNIDNFPDIPALGGKAGAAGLADWQKNGGVLTVLPPYKGPVLLLNGEADTQTIVQGARETDAALTKAGNSDHTLKTYPGLGHTFYPAISIAQPLGAPQPQVLQDLGDWLSQRFLKK